MRLVYDDGSMQEVKVGDIIQDRDGYDMVVEYFAKPHKSTSQGKVSVSRPGYPGQREYYVSVIGATWIEREDQ